MHKILVIGLYFLLDALHVSDYISPKHVEHLIENKVQSQEFVHLVGSYTQCYNKMLHCQVMHCAVLLSR